MKYTYAHITLICPKCKKEYTSNPPTSSAPTYCVDCKKKLVEEKLINNFDDMGNYSPKPQIFDLDKSNLFELYMTMRLYAIKDFFEAVDGEKIILATKVDEDETKICANLSVIGVYDNKEYELLRAKITEHSFMRNKDAKDDFMKYTIINIANSVISSMYNYILMDKFYLANNDTSPRITLSLFDAENILD